MKEQNKVLRGIGIVLSILLVVSSLYLLYQLIKINVLPTKLLFLIVSTHMTSPTNNLVLRTLING